MGKIQRSVMPKGGRRGSTGLKGKVHRSVSRVPVKKTIVRDRSRDYHGVDKLERKVRALEEEEAGGSSIEPSARHAAAAPPTTNA